MGWSSWFSLSTPDQAGPVSQSTKDGGFQAPNRSSRAQCWESRDIFFECLDAHNILDAVKDDEKARKLCPTELKYFEKDCAASWVKYFKDKRVMEWKRDRTIEKIKQEDAKAIAEAKMGRS